MAQGELFREEPLSISPEDNRKHFFSKYQLTLGADKLLIVAIGLLVLFVVTYCFGVEQGKRSAEVRFHSLIPSFGDLIGPTDPALGIREKEPKSVSGEEVVFILEEEAEAEPEPAESEIIIAPPERDTLYPLHDPLKKSDYTVQLVTYQTAFRAAEEVSRLEEGGHRSFVIPSGAYFQVCADYFKSKSRARVVLNRWPDPPDVRRVAVSYIRSRQTIVSAVLFGHLPA